MITLKTHPNQIVVESCDPTALIVWYSRVYSENVLVNMDSATLEHTRSEVLSISSDPDFRGTWETKEITRRWSFRRSKVGDWMRRELDTARSGFDPCPGWISEVLDTIIEYVVNKAIVE